MLPFSVGYAYDEYLNAMWHKFCQQSGVGDRLPQLLFNHFYHCEYSIEDLLFPRLNKVCPAAWYSVACATMQMQCGVQARFMVLLRCCMVYLGTLTVNANQQKSSYQDQAMSHAGVVMW